MQKKYKYRKSPLVEVTFQVNFPTILAIDAQDPVDFQKIVMRKYPNYDSQTEIRNEVTVNVANTKSDASFESKTKRKLHLFVSEDQKWKITLAKDMLAFSTTDYKYWEDMEEKAADVIKALNDAFSPLYYTRVGLRYIDAIDRKVLGLENTSWNLLLEPHICGSLSYKTDGNVTVRSSTVSSEIVIDDVFINLASGTGIIDRHDGTLQQEAFILNCDYYYNKKTTNTDLSGIASKLHDRSHTFFRESITDELHEAMEPEEFEL